MNLFSPILIGNHTLKNRIFMAPMTRCRSVEDHIPNDLMATYYAQRASAGLIISEATQISTQGIGYPCTPGIHTLKQIQGWKKTTEAVHDKGGKIFLQLWHVGRISHSAYHDGELPVAPSAIKPTGEVYTLEGMKEYETPRELSVDEIKELVTKYVIGAKNAIEAGFDGVEIHGANGYLIDQFLRDSTNKREDEYGSSIENRSRFLFDIIEDIIKEIGADKVGLRLSPSGTFNDMTDSNPKEHFTYICNELNKYKLAYLHIIDALEGDIRHGANVVELSTLREAYKGILITNGAYDKERGNQTIQNSLADAVAFGALYISNPNLPESFKTNAKLVDADTDTFYTQDEKGYTDYPTLG
ncbi:NADH:flavin oxidoreductase/NADH oxidase [Sulfurimonas gotlandica GD1]|uniref:NADH:flavin oxidoreductase/NADH oxidase n=1 Tax=Sulfurimonas gotlandica (strain DSM 19862 / JCM 16533 / GD1) TaxID=929558 RepID=B6BNG3_SULGG|nr:alkene reductase [Sulfurimonas gotlandica]EDZ61308.1 N-ethylmaleimide reductase [Sulfurimonas gotlandica GD1]EHP31033.1 NADH:flavin oxidoreductase/NADH oxidase [Sulfurimonas gotlandica GD1]